MINELYEIDCMEYMKDIPDNHFDLAIVDPPYGIHDKLTGTGRPLNRLYSEKSFDKGIPPKEYFSDLIRISENLIIWGGNYFTEYLSPNNNWIIWHKNNAKAYFSMAEMAWSNIRKNIMIYKRYVMNDNRDKIHPTQKPVALYKWLLTNYAKPGYKLFDSHSGSGSFRIAAYDMGFDLVSCELDADYCRDNEARFQRRIQQQELFTPEEIQEKIYQDKELFNE